MTPAHFRRRRIVVDQRFQWSLGLHGVMLGLLVLVAMSIGIFAPLLSNLGAQAPNEPADFDSSVVMLYMHENFWYVAVACLVLVTACALRLSHRIAGPMVRFKRNLRFVAEGLLPPALRTRRHDYMKEEVACLNAAVAGVRARVEAIRTAQAVLRRELHALAGRASSGERADFSAVFAAQRELEHRLAGFRETGELDGALPVGEGTAVVAFAGRGPQDS
jgi:hypothetical protein